MTDSARVGVDQNNATSSETLRPAYRQEPNGQHAEVREYDIRRVALEP